MTKQHFSFQEVFTFGWSKTRQHAWFIVLTYIIIGIIMSAVRFSPFIDCITSVMVAISVTSLALTISRDHHFTFADLYYPLLSYKRVLKFIALTAIYVLAVIIGFALLVLPGIYIAIRFKFFPFVALDHENASIPDLIRMSAKVTAHNFWSVFLFLLLGGMLNILGALALVVGLFFTIPVTFFAMAHMYNRLKEHSL